MKDGANRANRSVDALYFILQYRGILYQDPVCGLQHNHPSSAWRHALPGECARLPVQVDYGLLDGQMAVCKVVAACFWLLGRQYWIPPRLCPFSSFILPVHQQLHTSKHQAVKLMKFTNDITLLTLLSDGDESAYRSKMDHLVSRWNKNNLELSALKTVEMKMDFRKDPNPPPLLSS